MPDVNEIIREVLKEEGAAFFHTPSYYQNGMSYIFYQPEIILTAINKEDIHRVIKEADELRKEYKGYSYLSYEAGYLFEEKLEQYFNPVRQNNFPAAKFVFCKASNILQIHSSEIKIDFNEENNYSINNFHLNTSETEYAEKIKKIKDYIYAGDTYQVNFTVKGKFSFNGSIEGLFKQMLFNQSAGYISLINDSMKYFLSFSPELFFEWEGENIKSKPMKGTIRRGINLSSDKINETELRNSEKDLAENVMIVDLLRNDIGRVCNFGSVEAEDLFDIEKYESLFQMVSTVKGKVSGDITLNKIIEKIFPCGSITGAPKMRTMEIIHELEKEPRGIYTGSIGLLDENRTIYNVAIRTICIDKKSGEGEIGIGSGIVWDSDPSSEYKECLLKCNFLLNPFKYFELFETVLIKDGIPFLLNEHLERLKNAAYYFLFVYEEEEIIKEISKVLGSINTKDRFRMKILLNKTGGVKITLNEYSDNNASRSVLVSKHRISSEDKFRYFKTTNRELYNIEYEKYRSEYADVIFLNEEDELAEGAITNIFIKKDGNWFTPPLTTGILNGIYREYFMKKNYAKEKTLYLSDLQNADQIIIVNSLRGEISIIK